MPENGIWMQGVVIFWCSGIPAPDARIALAVRMWSTGSVSFGAIHAAAVSPASSAAMILETSSAVMTKGGDRMMVGPDTRIITPLS